MSHILTSIHGRRLGLDAKNRVIAPNGLRAGEHGAQTDFASGQTVAIFDDFTDVLLNTNEWGVLKGSDAGALNFVNTAGPSGTTVATCGPNVGASMATNGVQISGALSWQAASGSLVCEARVKLSAILNNHLFVGFTNQVAALQAPANASGVGNGVTFNAVDCVGILFDSATLVDNFYLVGQANSVPATVQDSKVAPVAATYVTLRTEVEKDGSAKFFINGLPVGQLMAGAVRTTVNLAPVVAGFTRSAATATVTLDYLNVSSLRV
jgi:hypothetical protein